MTKKQLHVLVDRMLETAATDALGDTIHSRAHAQGMYHAAKRIAVEVDNISILAWPFFCEWRDMLIAATVRK